MQVEKDRVVSFHYNLMTSESTMSESSKDGDPMVYLHGHGGLISGLEKEMQGKRQGDKFAVSVNPEDAYGLRRENATERIPIKRLHYKGKLRPNMVAGIETEHGLQEVTIIKVGKFNADVDLNHPLAGLTLNFEVEITDIREATAEEIQHGHAHGPGGHQH